MLGKVLLLALCVGGALAGYRNRVLKTRPTQCSTKIQSNQYGFSSSEYVPKWSGGEFQWPCSTSESLAKSGGKLIRKNVIATKALMSNNDVILALPRYKKGVPVTLAKFSMDSKDGCQALEAFPSWSLQEEGNCKAFQDVVDIFLDNNQHLWVLDTGIIESFEDQPIRKCTPKVVAINMETGNVVKTVDLASLATKSSRLQYVVAEYTTDHRVYIYVTDAAARAILVFDVSSGFGYRVLLPPAVTSDSEGRDVLYAALLRNENGQSNLVFTYLSGERLFAIRTEFLQNGCANGKIIDVGLKPKNMVILGSDGGSSLFFRYGGKPHIYQWDSKTIFCEENFKKVSMGDDTGCSLAMNVFPDYQHNKIRFLESNYPDFVAGTVGCGVDHSISTLP